MKCQICMNSKLFKFLSLGHQPPSDSFITEDQLNEPEVFYPLDLYLCENCYLVQLGYAVNPVLLFNESYIYNTGSNKGLVKNFHELTKKLIDRFYLTEKDLAVDIGSNDGTLLEGYKLGNVKTLGIEPTGVANMAIANGITTIKKFFNKNTAEFVSSSYGKAKVITATNVFAHVVDLDGFMSGIKLLLSDGGVYVSESHHILSLINEIQYDSFYHEHLRSYSVRPLIRLFNNYGMDVFDVELIKSHGGSIRVYACHKGAHAILPSVESAIKIEEQAGLYDKNTFVEFAKIVEKRGIELRELLLRLKKEGKEVVGIGAPAKGNTMLNYTGTGKEIAYLLETSLLKIGMYSPGQHIKVIDEKYLFEKQPDYGLLLSWNIKDIIIPKLREKGYKGKIIIPIPELHVVD